MGEVVDMAGRVLSPDDHPFGDDVAHCTEGEKNSCVRRGMRHLT